MDLTGECLGAVDSHGLAKVKDIWVRIFFRVIHHWICGIVFPCLDFLFLSALILGLGGNSVVFCFEPAKQNVTVKHL